MMRRRITEWLIAASERAQAAGVIPAFSTEDVVVERPANPQHGDYASSLALKLARTVGRNPMALAQALVERLETDDSVQRVELARPGFLNFYLSEDWLRGQTFEVVRQGERFGEVDLGGGNTVLIEFVSANPTGPLTAAAGRAGAFGDALANILAMAGYNVSREYYLNDVGSRMDAFYRSVYTRYCQQFGREVEIPPDGYLGAYMIDLARQIVESEGDRFLNMYEATAIVEIGRLATEMMVQSARATLERLGIHYQTWFSDQSLYDTGAVMAAIEELRQRGAVRQREGAVWFVFNLLGEDVEDVLIRSNGEPTYLASDIAYHVDKLVRRRFDTAIDIFGSDHQGHIQPMKPALAILGLDPERLKIIIHQLITLRRGNEIVRMSKRTGDLITLDEVIDEVGPDACRFFFLSRSVDSQMDFDLELAKAQSDENPVYYVQYAHARIASILRLADEKGLTAEGAEVSLLTDPAELQLIRKILELPEVIELAARNMAPHHLPHYAQELATAFHWFYTQCRVISDDPALSAARLLLCQAAKVALGRTLALMGMSAPERM